MSAAAPLLDVAHYRSSPDIRTFAVAQEALQTRENQDLISGGGDGSPRLCPRVCLEIPLVSLIRGGGDGSPRLYPRVCLEIPLVSLIRCGGDGSLRVA